MRGTETLVSFIVIINEEGQCIPIICDDDDLYETYCSEYEEYEIEDIPAIPVTGLPDDLIPTVSYSICVKWDGKVMKYHDHYPILYMEATK
jgi:hypothetical protein